LNDRELMSHLKDIVIEGFDYTDPCNYGDYDSYEINIVNESALTFINSYDYLIGKEQLFSDELVAFVFDVIVSKHRSLIEREYRDSECDEEEEDQEYDKGWVGLNDQIKNIIDFSHEGKLNEDLLETEPLYFTVPNKYADELGIKLISQNDVVYVLEIHFDTKNVIFEVGSEIPDGEFNNYNDINNIFNFPAFYSIPIDELPQGVKSLIVRRLEKHYLKYL
jgi:hypothetical protein